MRYKNSGQVSIEALFVIGTMFLLFIGVMVFRMEKMREITFWKQDIDSKNACLELSDSLVQLSVAASSAKMKTDYSFSVYGQTITMLPRNITCVLTAPVVNPTTISKGFFKIERVGNKLVLTNL